MKSIAATVLIAVTLLAGSLSVANAASYSGYPSWAQKAFSPKDW